MDLIVTETLYSLFKLMPKNNCTFNTRITKKKLRLIIVTRDIRDRTSRNLFVDAKNSPLTSGSSVICLRDTGYHRQLSATMARVSELALFTRHCFRERMKMRWRRLRETSGERLNRGPCKTNIYAKGNVPRRSRKHVFCKCNTSTL